MRKINMMIVFLVILLASASFVSALGVSPGRTTLNFEPGFTKDISFSVINSERKATTVVFYVRGDLKDYVTLSQQSATFSAGEESKSFSYNIKLPQKIDIPGEKKTEIVILEVSPESTIKTEEGREVVVLDSAGVSASLSVITQLNVYVLHPGKYIESTLDIIPEDDNNVKFIIPVTSKGKLGIGNVQASIDIYTSLNEKITTINTNSIPLQSKERKEIFAEWEFDPEIVKPGKYRAVATITYDGETTYADKNFDIGSRVIEIETIEVRDFKLGEIAKFNILVNNNWNEEIKNVNVQMIIYNKEGEIMADFKSANYDIVSLGKTEIVSYWDTVGISEDEYDGKLILKYGDQIAERPIKIKVMKDNIEVVGFTGKAIFPKKRIFSLTNILVGSVILLVVINAVWLFLFLRKKKKNKNK